MSATRLVFINQTASRYSLQPEIKKNLVARTFKCTGTHIQEKHEVLNIAHKLMQKMGVASILSNNISWFGEDKKKLKKCSENLLNHHLYCIYGNMLD